MFNILNLQELIPEFFYLPEMLLNENKVLLIINVPSVVCRCQSIWVELDCFFVLE